MSSVHEPLAIYDFHFVVLSFLLQNPRLHHPSKASVLDKRISMPNHQTLCSTVPSIQPPEIHAAHNHLRHCVLLYVFGCQYDSSSNNLCSQGGSDLGLDDCRKMLTEYGNWIYYRNRKCGSRYVPASLPMPVILPVRLSAKKEIWILAIFEVGLL